MVAPHLCKSAKQKRQRFAVGAASVAVLLLVYHRVYLSSQDLTDVFYPSTTGDQLSNQNGASDIPSSKDELAWIYTPPLTPLHDDKTIFLLETSGRTDINHREWCAVESAARAHPHYTVLLLVASSRIRRTPLATSVLALNNTRLAQLRFWELFEGTVLEDWYKSRVILRSWWQASHMSDALRFALLMRFGGIYLDTDVIVRRSMEEMDDGAGLESEHSIAAGVLKFSRRSAMPGRLAKWFVNNYDPHDWGSNGPGVVTAVLLRKCGLGPLPLPPSRCGEYTIFSSRRFYGVPWPDWQLLLQPSQKEVVLELVDDSYVVHTWGLHITGHPAPPGSAMYQLAEQHCPLALRHAGLQF